PFRYFIFSQNLWTIHPNFFAEAWSLSVEEWFYISLPICFILFGFINRSKSNTSIVSFLLFLIFLFLSFRINESKPSFNLLQWDYSIRKIVIYRLDSILYGVLFFVLISSHSPFYKSKRYLLLFVGLIILLSSYYLFYLKLFPIYNTVFFL